jgi:hypothetical protein
MQPDLPPDTEILRLTCQIVAACCQSLPIEAGELPALIASVSKSLRAQKPTLAQEASATVRNSRSGAKARPAQATKRSTRGTSHRASQTAPLQTTPPSRAESTNVVYLNAFSRASARGGPF